MLILFLTISALTYAASLHSIVWKICQEEGFSYDLACSIIEAESGWNPNAKWNRTWHRGLWQLSDRFLPYFADRYNDHAAINPYDPAVSTRVAIRYLKSLCEFFGSWYLALLAYNAGPTTICEGIIPNECVAYALRILRQWGMEDR
jgi:membrane-bound lytic murein transglycosylase D